MPNPTQLNLWVMPNTGFDTFRIMQRELTLFRKENPGYEVHLSVHPWSFAWDRLVAIANHRDDDPPDVIQIGGTWTTTLAALGILADITDYLDDANRPDVIRATWNYCYEPTRTKAYSLPWFLDTRVLFYRGDILEKIGVTAEAIGTWEGFRDACERVRDHRTLRKEVFPLALAGQREGILIHDLAPWIWGIGGNFFSSSRRHAEFHEPLALRGLDFYFRLMADRLIPLMGRDRLSNGNFFSGQFAFQVSGAWPLHSYLNPRYPYAHAKVAQHYGTAVFPAGPAGQVTYLGGSNLAMTRASKHPDGAWKLIKFLTSATSQVRHSKQIGMLPSRYTALEEFLNLAPTPVADVFRHSLRVARTLPCAATLGTLERILGRASQKVMGIIRNNSYTDTVLAEEMATAAKEADYILSLYE